jgi:hypothetical protein
VYGAVPPEAATLIDPLALGVTQGVTPVMVGLTDIVTPLQATTLVSVKLAEPVHPAELLAMIV